MIQRIQSIFLLVSAISFGALFKLPFASTSKTISPIFEDTLYNISDNTILLGLTILGLAIALINIFLFNNRQLQLRLGYVLIIISLFLPIVAIWLFFTLTPKIGDQASINDGLGIYLPIVALIMAILSNRFIAKDHNKVRSMDRLR